MMFMESPFFLGKQELIRWAASITRESEKPPWTTVPVRTSFITGLCWLSLRPKATRHCGWSGHAPNRIRVGPPWWRARGAAQILALRRRRLTTRCTAGWVNRIG